MKLGANFTGDEKRRRVHPLTLGKEGCCLLPDPLLASTHLDPHNDEYHAGDADSLMSGQLVVISEMKGR